MLKEQLMQLWQDTFGDSHEFIRLFFDQVYKEENTITIQKEGKVISVLYMVPYTLSFYGKKIPLCYICGVATVPSEQGKGHMRNLLQQAFRIMEQRGFILSALIPAENWLFDYYRGLGYRELFDYKLIRFLSVKKAVSRSYQISPITATEVNKVYAYFDQKLQHLPVALLHSIADFNVILEDLHLSAGELLVAYNAKGKIKGIAFCYPDKTEDEVTIKIKELLTDSEVVKEDLLTFSSSYFESNKIYYRQPATRTDRAHYGMIKIMDRVELINYWISSKGGNKEKLPLLEKMNEVDLLYTLFNYPEESPHMSLMLD